jgi:hypothetical protein
MQFRSLSCYDAARFWRVVVRLCHAVLNSFLQQNESEPSVDKTAPVGSGPLKLIEAYYYGVGAGEASPCPLLTPRLSPCACPPP